MLMKAFLVIGMIVTAGLLAGCAGTTSLSSPQSASVPQQGLLSAGVTTPETSTTRKAAFDPFRDESDTGGFTRRHVISNPTIAQVMQLGALPEVSIGRADAPVTIVKYASLTCPYCRKFQLETFPILKKEYIDTGKVRFILREFPIGFQSGAATIALRCVPQSAYFSLYSKFLLNQRAWVSQEIRHDPIFKIVKQSGLTRAKFDACYQDKALIENLKRVKDRGRTLGVIGTPNFFVNGKLIKRVLTMKDFHKFVSEALANSVASTHTR